ncbi:MAG: hypothetical protein M3Y27_01560 [Acidobacteriota bacterium]|nr:hypothetical protein [Acidobacteriota bacterium]
MTWLTFILLVPEVIFGLLLACVAYSLRKSLWALFRENRYAKEHPGYSKTIAFDGELRGVTATGLSVNYRLGLTFNRINDEEFNAAKMLALESQQALADRYSREVFLPLLSKRGYEFVIGKRHKADESDSDDEFCAAIARRISVAGEKYLEGISYPELSDSLRKLSYKGSGCQVQFREFFLDSFSEEVIENNYASLAEDELEVIEQSERYAQSDEKLAVAALKRRLTFLREHKRQIHDTYGVVIETEASGRALKIAWRFKANKPPASDLIGMRKTGGGFFPNYGDLVQNGSWVIQSSLDGKTTEPLNEGETYFYTFVFRSWANTKDERIYPVARFKVTMESKAETDAIEETISRLQVKTLPDPERETLSKALKELGSYLEMDTAFEAMEHSFVGQIENSQYSAETKAQKIERLQDIVRQIRSKYEP